SAVPLGVARLEGYRFIITADGYASVVPQPRACVHGRLWRLTARDRVTLDQWENIAGGMYRAAMLPIIHAGKRRRVLVYVARRRPRSRARHRLPRLDGSHGARARHRRLGAQPRRWFGRGVVQRTAG